MQHLMKWIKATLSLCVLFLLSACGLKGDLYLPEKNEPVVIISAPTPPSSSSSSSAAQP